MNKDNKFYKLHIFSAGTHTSASGHECTLTQDDLNNTADIFVSNHRVPLCLGHSSYKKKDVLPSMGWFRAVKEEDGELYGLLEATTAGKALLDGGYYENFSASFYAPDSPLNPKPGCWTLRHVAALGEEPPSLKELDPMLEIIPEDFAEVQDFNMFYEFKAADAQDFEEFDDGTSFLLPDSYDFKTFRKFGKSLNCKNGFKQCGGRCIPNAWKCKEGTSSKYKPGTQKKYNKPSKVKRAEKQTPQKTPKSDFVPKEEWQKKKAAEKAQKKAEETKKNLTVGNLKALAGSAVLIGSSLMSEKYFPDNKTASGAVKLLGNLAAGQFVVKDGATMSDRLRGAVYDGFKGTLGLTVEGALGDNPYAETMSKASVKLFETALDKSGLVDTDIYDSYAKNMMDAIDGFGSAIRDTQKYKKAKTKFQKTEKKVEERAKELESKLDEYGFTKEDIAGIRYNQKDFRSELESLREMVNKGNIDRKKMKAGHLAIVDALDKIVENADVEGFKNKLPQILEALQRSREAFDYSEGEVLQLGGNYRYMGDKKLTYANSDVKIQLTLPEQYAMILPIVLCVLRYLGLYDDNDLKKASVKDVPSGNPELDAIFSEVQKAKGVLNHDVSNDELQRALFGDKRLITDEDFNEETKSDIGWKIGNDNGRGHSAGKRKRRKQNRDFSDVTVDNNGRSMGGKRRGHRRSPERMDKPNLNNIIDDAIYQAMFSEGEQNTKRRSRSDHRRVQKSRTNNFHFSETPGKSHAHNNQFREGVVRDVRQRLRKGTKRIDFNESQETQDITQSAEYQALQQKLEVSELRGRRLEVENFCEKLYDEAKISAGWIKKNDLVDFLMRQNTQKGSFDFGEGSSSGGCDYDFMANLLNNLEPVVSFSEVTDNDNTFLEMPRFEEGYDVESQKTDFKIKQLMELQPNLTYSEAWAKVASRGIL